MPAQVLYLSWQGWSNTTENESATLSSLENSCVLRTDRTNHSSFNMDRQLQNGQFRTYVSTRLTLQ
jgi:hypothetical protein